MTVKIMLYEMRLLNDKMSECLGKMSIALDGMLSCLLQDEQLIQKCCNELNVTIPKEPND